jgi:hypothetical protein
LCRLLKQEKSLLSGGISGRYHHAQLVHNSLKLMLKTKAFSPHVLKGKEKGLFLFFVLGEYLNLRIL